uniref:Uncharacterized protein n=1 Tax=Anguilla anguilla TaxID=7936 RepID=A0A0E9VHQ6_ANGAN
MVIARTKPIGYTELRSPRVRSPDQTAYSMCKLKGSKTSQDKSYT